MANVTPTSFKKDLGTAKIDWLNDTFKMMLLTNAATPAASWAHRSDVTNEVTGTGYTAGGAALATEAINTSGTTQQYTSASVAWTTATITARYAVIYKSRGGASSADELVMIFDFGSDVTSTAGTFTVNPSGSGWFTI
jgi:hypothetical protein